MALGMAWRDQIQDIIAETERNLGFKARPASLPPPRAAAPPAAPAIFAHPASAVQAAGGASNSPGACAAACDASCTGSFSSAALAKHLLSDAALAAASGGMPCAASFAVPANESVRPLLEASLDGSGRAAQSRVLETVKFELDVRGKHVAAQLEAVRDEMASSSVATEKKWVEIARQIESSVGASVQAEATMRAHTDAQLAALRDASASAHQETMRIVSEFQQTAIDHSEVLRRLDTDLGTFRQATETRLAEDERKLSSALSSTAEMRDLLDATGGSTRRGGAEGAPLSTEHEERLSDIENALLQERDFRKRLEEQLSELRETGPRITAETEAAIDAAVGDAFERSGRSSPSP